MDRVGPPNQSFYLPIVYRPGPQPISARLFPPLLFLSRSAPPASFSPPPPLPPPFLHQSTIASYAQPNQTPPLPINATRHRCRGLCAPKIPNPRSSQWQPHSRCALRPRPPPPAPASDPPPVRLSLSAYYVCSDFLAPCKFVFTCFMCSVCCSGEGRVRGGGAGGTWKAGGACSGCSCVTLLFWIC